MLTIRFARSGRKNQAFFKLVVAEKSQAVQKKFIEKLGYFNPHTDSGKGEFVYDKERVLHFINNGAQMSQTVARKLSKDGLQEAGKFIEQRVTKPKKEAPKPEVEEVVEEAPVAEAEEAPAVEVEETPKEEAAA